MPCTNVPIHCRFCPPSISGEPRTIWKYSAINLLKDLPGTYKLPLIPPEMLIDMFVSRSRWLTREENELPGSDDIAALMNEPSTKRGRGPRHWSVVEPDGKRRKE
ncbi:hypothetical protein CPB84DRAFT_1773992 [Gymnopilus junonius]|uniref:Uncharacterized protein n=1 Tax=Gymnopilus junonius TaxID=109634 RepID=A0A9P5TQJ3_GYMJU|nr:hypothetical protein CPB84DRAFT_1773992 [Gymnopilus junonius]